MLYIIMFFLFYVLIASAYGGLYGVYAKTYNAKIEGMHLLYPFFGFAILVALSQFAGIFVGAKLFNPFFNLWGYYNLFYLDL